MYQKISCYMEQLHSKSCPCQFAVRALPAIRNVGPISVVSRGTQTPTSNLLSYRTEGIHWFHFLHSSLANWEASGAHGSRHGHPWASTVDRPGAVQACGQTLNPCVVTDIWAKAEGPAVLRPAHGRLCQVPHDRAYPCGSAWHGRWPKLRVRMTRSGTEVISMTRRSCTHVITLGPVSVRCLHSFIEFLSVKFFGFCHILSNLQYGDTHCPVRRGLDRPGGHGPGERVSWF